MKHWRNRRTATLVTVSALAIFGVSARAVRSSRGSVSARAANAARTAASARGRQLDARSDAARFSARVDEVLSAGAAAKAAWGLVVADAGSGEIIYARNADSYFQPASNVKLFTTAMALAVLGPAYRERTTIESAGRLERDGHLAGDLILVGRGDANLSNHVLPFLKKEERTGPPDVALAQLADQVAAKGVKQVDGDVVADDSYFVLERFPPGWTVDDTVWSYGAAVSAIAINDNEMTLEVRPGAEPGAPLRLKLNPLSGLYALQPQAVTTPPGTAADLRLARDPDSRVFVVSGSLPLNAAPRELVVAVSDPAEQAAALLLRLLEDRGIKVRGHARAVHAAAAPPVALAGEPSGAPAAPRDKAAASRLVLAERLSPPLVQDVRLTNKLSINLHAELMLRVAAKEKGSALTMDDALAWAAQFRQSIGIDPKDVQLTDGSGLSRSNLVTPRAIVALLEYAQRQPWGADFASSLPAAGEDGTLEQRMKSTAAAGRVQAKTGYINHAAALSGYATTARGQRVVFSIMGSDIGAGAAEAMAAVDAICTAIVEELGSTPQ